MSTDNEILFSVLTSTLKNIETGSNHIVIRMLTNAVLPIIAEQILKEGTNAHPESPQYQEYIDALKNTHKHIRAPTANESEGQR